MGASVEFENKRVRVLRVQHAGGERQPQVSRNDRLIIYLTDGHIQRSEGGKSEGLRRRTGEVVWRDRSQHQIENLRNAPHEVLIVELKD
jgi:hypothetical protein